MSKTINSSKCETCKYGTIDESNKARIIVECSLKEKKYCYGQYISCDDYTKQATQ
jgi:hypothetical protein